MNLKTVNMNTIISNSDSLLKKVNLPIEFLSNKKGLTTAVQISYNEWLKFVKEYLRYKEYYEMKNKLTQAFVEIKETQKGLKKEKTLSEFLNEC